MSEYILYYTVYKGHLNMPYPQSREENQMAKNDRFEKVYSQGTMNITEIWVDKETGVNYVFHKSGYAGGITPLLDREGKPIITAVVNR